MGKIKVFVKLPGRAPYSTNISNTLENLQRFVEGPIEVGTILKGIAIIFNEEGKLRDLPYNCRFLGTDFVGNIIFVGISGEDFCDIPVEFKDFKKLFKSLWEEN